MTTIDPRQSVTALVREQLAVLRERGSTRRTDGAAPRQPVGGALAQGIAALSSADPDHGRKAVRLFLESRIASALGEELLNDPGFPRMLDAVQAQMQADAQTAGAMQSLGEWLLAGGAARAAR